MDLVFGPDGRVRHAECPKALRAGVSARRDAYRAELVRARLAVRALPSWEPNKMRGRTSAGSRCSGCDTPISAGQIEYELEFANGPTLRLHRACYVVWQEERGSTRRDIGGGSAASPSTLLFD